MNALKRFLQIILILTYSNIGLADDLICRQKAKAEALKVYSGCIENSKHEPTKKIIKPSISNATIKKILIEKSIENYPGNCPCPYHAARNGSRCGGRSAYSKYGGASPLCYDSDVSNEMVSDYRQRNL